MIFSSTLTHDKNAIEHIFQSTFFLKNCKWGIALAFPSAYECFILKEISLIPGCFDDARKIFQTSCNQSICKCNCGEVLNASVFEKVKSIYAVPFTRTFIVSRCSKIKSVMTKLIFCGNQTSVKWETDENYGRNGGKVRDLKGVGTFMLTAADVDRSLNIVALPVRPVTLTSNVGWCSFPEIIDLLYSY